MSGGALFEYSTSHRIEQVALGLLRKDLSDAALIGSARTNRVPFLHDARREPAIYTGLLRAVGIGPKCFAAGDDWIVLERVDGTPLWQHGNAEVWVMTARWLAGMHARLAEYCAAPLPFVRYNERITDAWRKRAASAGVPQPLLEAHREASWRLDRIDHTIIHGELYPSNVLVRVDSGRDGAAPTVDVWPVDWEVAGLGPGVFDVAALTAGWPADSPVRAAMERAYFEAAGGVEADWSNWCDDLRAARLAVCVQWLAQEPSWLAPEQHRQDWLAEATELAEATT